MGTTNDIENIVLQRVCIGVSRAISIYHTSLDIEQKTRYLHIKIKLVF